ncbi:PAS domain S-box protein [Aerosakkonemataceae cyanobacterium BLCC-F154]|uniref:histidine kinase n=1 Tax=Floridaenema fluviatile BLCC-F154 TaxID=3153640 RepID=A0ABV4YH26_9CYAN
MNSNQVKSSRINILVVAHRQDEQDFLSLTLSSQGYQVQQVQTEQFMLSILQKTLPDLILLDNTLTETDSYEFCLSLKTGENTQKIPVIFLVEDDNLETRAKVFQVGGIDYIKKPFLAQEVISKVASRLTIINSFQPQQEERIIERLKLWERAIAASSNGIVITDATKPNNPVIYVNAGFEKLTGYTAEEVVGKNCRFLQRGDTNQPGLRELKNAIREHKECLVTLRNYRKDGTCFWNELSISPVRDPAGNLTHFIGVQTDITQSKQAKEELKIAKERFELAICAANDGFWDWDFITGKIYFSPRWKEMIGYADSELPNEFSSWEKVIFHEDKITALKLINDYNSGKISQFLTTQRFYHKDGSTVYILSRAIHLKDETGKVIRMVGAHTDVTELVKSSTALANSQSLLKGVLNSSLDGVMAFSPVRNSQGEIIDFQWLLANQAAAQIIGCSAEDLVGKKLLQEMPGNREIGLFKKYVQVVETGKPQKMEFYYSFEGIEAWFQNVAVKLDDGFAVTFRNITSEKKAEAERLQLIRSLQETEERFREIAENVREVFFVISPDSQEMIYVSPGYEKIFGYSCDRIYQNPQFWTETIHPEDKRQVISAFQKQLESHKVFNEEYRIIRVDGEIRWLWTRCFPIQNETGEIYRLVGIAEDITDRKQAEIALEQQIIWASLLREITQEIRSSLDPQQIFQTAVTQIGKTFNVSRCLLHTYINDPEPQIVSVAEYLKSGYNSIMDLEVLISGNLFIQEVLLKDRAIASDDISTDPRFNIQLTSNSEIKLLSVLAVRTSYQDLPNGVICLQQCDRLRHWKKHEIELLEAVAAQVGIALSQANLLEQEKKQRLELDNQNLQLQEEIRQRHRMHVLLDWQNQILELIAKGEPVYEILEVLARFIELQSQQALCSFLMLDTSTNRLHIGASPSLPDSYNQAIDGIEIGPEVGSCGTAAYHKTAVIVEDIATSRLWVKFKDLALSHGLRACWSTPIFSSEGDVLATFSMYYRQPQSPSASDRHLIAKAVHLAKVAIERHKSEQNHRTIFDASYDGIAILNIDTGKLLDVNEKLCQMFGVKREVVLQLEFNDLSLGESPYSQKEAWEYMQKAAKGELQKFEWHSKHASGKLFWTEIIMKPIVLGSKERLLSVIRDISDRKRSEEALLKAAYAAEAANRTKSQFLANMSHELRTPLNAILGFTQLMNRDAKISPQQQEYVDIINRSGEHLLTLINDILSMSKIEAGQINLNEVSFDLYRLLDDLEDMFRLKAQSKKLQLIFNLASDLPQYVKTDESKLRQVLINLLSNAIKFTNSGSVTLSVQKSATENENPSAPCVLYFAIEDTGSGISPQEIDKLFEAFVQTETGRNSQEGTGLGLPISREFIKLMGGQINVSSLQGKGSVFKFNIQVTLAETNEINQQVNPKKVISLERNQKEYRILIVEDKLENRQLLRSLLSPLGFQIQEAVNGAEAIAIWANWQPDLILMDMRMPVMDGYQATKKIKATPKGKDTIIIAITASAFYEDRSLSLTAGCDDFIGKPFRENVLFEKIAKYLGVRYIYGEPNPSTSELSATNLFTQTTGKQSLTLNQQALQIMPNQWIQQLHKAAICADEELIFQLLSQIPETNANLTKTLTDLVNNFRLDQIISITEKIAE